MKLVSRRGVGRHLFACLGLAAAVAVALGSLPAQAQEIKVTIDNFTFTPAELNLKVGDSVTWTNHDDIPHTIVSAGKFRSKRWTPMTASPSPSPPRAITDIFVRCTRT